MGGTVDGPTRPTTVVDTPPVADHAPSTTPATTPSADAGPADPSAVFKKKADATFDGTGIKAKLDNMDGTDRHSTAARHSYNFAGMPEFQALPAAVRGRLSDPSLENQLSRLVETNLYSGLTTEQRTKLLNVFAAAGPDGREALLTLMSRKLESGQPALLSPDNTDKGTTLLDNLDHLATQPLAPQLAGRRGEIVSDVIKETAEPTWYLDQGKVGTCAPTSMQTHLALNSPSEYARLISGLASPARSATLANGKTMQAASKDLDTSGMGQSVPDPNDETKRIPDTRSVTERMFQSALTQYAYRESGRQDSVNANLDIPGLNGEEQAAALSGLYGKKYESIRASGGGVFNEAMQKIITDKIQKELSQGKGPVPVALNWGGSGHMVLVDKIEKNKDGTTMVYIRNPWGSSDARGSSYKDGAVLGTLDNDTGAGPKRVVVDHQSGLEAMTLTAFQEKLRGAVVAK